MTLDFGRGDRPTMRIGTGQMLGEYMSAAAMPDQRKYQVHRQGDPRGADKVDRPQRKSSVPDSVIKWNNRARVCRATREGGRQMRDESTRKGGARPPVVVQA